MFRSVFLTLSLFTTILIGRSIFAPPPCSYDQQLEETIAGELQGTSSRTLERDLNDFWTNNIQLPDTRTIARYYHWANKLPPSCTRDAYLRAISSYERE